jgi:hypothetical protein
VSPAADGNLDLVTPTPESMRQTELGAPDAAVSGKLTASPWRAIEEGDCQDNGPGDAV